MEFYTVIEERRSVRSFRVDPIPDDVLLRILEAARKAPSANNFQPWKFIVVKDEEKKRKIADFCMGQNFIAEAPVVIVACGLPTPSRIGGYTTSMLVDVAIAVEHLILAATNEGLGTCWIGAFDNIKLKRLLGIPDEIQVVAVIPVGYPLRKGWKTPRKELEEIVCFEKYED
ncbi:nitroreductase family protein [Candidatus Calescamantes bacterium]|nr:nitroreductase family protein [Candidatus Calescamantes bacterium]